MNEIATPGGAALIVGASRGIGLALVEALLAGGRCEIVAAACREPAQASRLEALAGMHVERLHVLELDVTRETSVAAAARALKARVSRVSLLVNCAGVLHDGALQPEKRLADIDPDQLRRAFEVNAIGPALVAKHFERFFDRRERTVLANLSARVASIGDNGLGGWYGYRASKAAQNMVTRNLSIELRRRYRGIICVALHPGTVDTALSRPFQRNVPTERLFTPARAAKQLLDVIDGLDASSNGGFFAWDGTTIAW